MAPIHVDVPEWTTARARLPLLKLIAPAATLTVSPLICSVNSDAPDAIAVPSVAIELLSVFEITSKLATVVSNSEPSVTWMLEPLTSTRLSAVVVSPVTLANVQSLIC